MLRRVSAMLLALLIGADAAHASAAERPVDQIVVKLRDGTGPSAAQRLSVHLGVRLQPGHRLASGAETVKLDGPLDRAAAEAMATRIARLADVQYAEPDLWIQPTAIPADPLFSRQWHLRPADVEAGTYGVNAMQAWDMTVGSERVVVAVVDTGLLPHIEFSGRMVPGYDFISSAAMARDGDGRDSHAFDEGDYATDGECGTRTAGSSSSWHGTHVAGILGATGNNGLGVAGLDWRTRILPVRVLGACGGYLSDIMDGVRWAAGLPVPGAPTNVHPARVINLSLGGLGTCGRHAQEAVDAARNAGALVVVAAGNDAADASASVPANCAGVVTVASTSRLGRRARYSNFGGVVAVSAPGGDMSVDSGILSTIDSGVTRPALDNAYRSGQGTSMAAPVVSGIASLVWSVNPELSVEAVARILSDTARAFPASGSPYDCTISLCGAGIVDARAAVAAAGGSSDLPIAVPVPQPAPPPTSSPAPGSSVSAPADAGGGGSLSLGILMPIVLSLAARRRRPR